MVRWCQEHVTSGAPGPWWCTVALAAVAGVALEPVHTTLGLGQINLLLLALVLGLDGRDTRWSGAGAGLAAAIKVTPTLLVLAQLLRGDGRAFRRGVVTLLVTTALAAAVAPAATLEYFGRLLWDTSRPGDPAYLQNQSLHGLVARHLGLHATLLWQVVALATLALGAWAVRRHRRDAFAALTIAGVTALLVSPISWSHHWVWVLPVTAVGLAQGRRTPWFWASLSLLLAALVADPARASGAPTGPAQDLYVYGGLAWLLAAALAPARAGSRSARTWELAAERREAEPANFL